MFNPDSVIQAEPGTKFVYHTGQLARDRERSSDLHSTANAMMKLAQRGYVFLFQKRLGARSFQYQAIRRRRVA